MVLIKILYCPFVGMMFHAGARLLPLMGLVVLLSSAPPLVGSVNCPANSVMVSNGTLMFQPLSPGSDNIDPMYNPGAIGGWYSLAAGFVDVVRSGSLPYGEYGLHNEVKVPIRLTPRRAMAQRWRGKCRA